MLYVSARRGAENVSERSPGPHMPTNVGMIISAAIERKGVTLAPTGKQQAAILNHVNSYLLSVLA